MVGLLSLLLKVGATLYLEPRFRATRFASLVDRERITFIHGSPTVFRLLLEERSRLASLPSVRLLVCGAAHASQALIRAAREWMPNASFRTAWGMTETTSIGTLLPVDALADGDAGCCGVPSPGLRIRVLGDDGADVPRGCRGELVVFGPSVAMGYEGSEEGIDRGWLHTGDIGFVAEDGHVHVVGRTKDVINRGGEKIACVEVEEELERLPGVTGAAVVGVPDDLYGEVPVAAVALEEGFRLDEDVARAALATRLAHYKVPDRIVAVDRLPLTAGMKLDKRSVCNLVMEALRR
jgi:fatty-acyl-CoA synthase/long-chain acyl-CoA synthetase